MSTNLLYHGWGVRGYDHVAVFYEQGIIRFGIQQQPGTFRCSDCSSTEVTKSGLVTRRFRSLPIGGKAVWIELPIQRLWCCACGKCLRQDPPGQGGLRRPAPRLYPCL